MRDSQIGRFPIRCNELVSFVRLSKLGGQVRMIAGFPHKGDVFEDDTDPPTFRRSFEELFGEPCQKDRKSPREICDLMLFPQLEGGRVLDGELDGLSGSPVFAWSARDAELWYRGMVITGGGNRARLIRELCVRSFLDAIIEQ